MKQYIAYGANGQNLRFDTKKDLMQYFGYSSQSGVTAYVNNGKPFINRRTQEVYYLDELESDERQEAVE